MSVRRHVRICWADAEPKHEPFPHGGTRSEAHAYTRDGIAREAGVSVKLVREHARQGLLREQSPYQMVAWIAKRQRQDLLGHVSWRALKEPITDQDFVEVLGLAAVVLPRAFVLIAGELPERLGPATVERWSCGRTLPGEPMKARVFRAVAKLVRNDHSTEILVDALDRMDGRHARTDDRELVDRIIEHLGAGPAGYRDIARALEVSPKVVSNALGLLRQHGLAETDGGVWRLVEARAELAE